MPPRRVLCKFPHLLMFWVLLTRIWQSERCQSNDWAVHKVDCEVVSAINPIPHLRFDRTMMDFWGSLAQKPATFSAVRSASPSGVHFYNIPLILSQLALAAGMGNVDPSTQYLFFKIYVELAIPNSRASIRGLHTELTIEETLQRPHLHQEESAASWDAKFRIQRNGGRTRLLNERLVEVLVHVCMTEDTPDPEVFMTRQFVHAVAHTQIIDPYAEPTRAEMSRLGEDRFRDKFWATACLILHKMATTPPRAT